MLQITFNNLTFHYETTFQNVFDSLSMIISGDWKSALIGRNGRGKTTLFRLITGVLKPVSGTLQVPFEVKYFPFSPPHPQEITRVVIKESIAPFASWEKKINELSGKTDDESIKWYSNYFDLFMYNDGYTIDALIEKEAGNLGLDIDILNRPFNSLSGAKKHVR